MRDIAFVVLHLLLVTSQLVLNFVHALIHRRLRSRTLLTGHEIMLVFGRHQNLDFPGLLSMSYGNLDGHQPAKILAQLLCFVVQVTMLLRAQIAVPRRDLDLHSETPYPVAMPISPLVSASDINS
jgi:hypothetical protein